MKAPTFPNVKVVGMHFRGDHAKAWAEAVEPGTEVFYEREPENKYDSYAIKVLYNLQHVGYIEATQACFIAPWMDEGTEFTCIVTDKQPGARANIHPIVCFTPLEEAEEVVEEQIEETV
ncbi:MULTISPECIES: HIRAN domain-containing protein [unclassified Roseobacter]|uniref:HIRAN domain-containing protein n=1 Tax=unclassified Roseobacter TaxID=196798 RepID=UPI001492FC2F|nr:MULTISPECIES: HIRAN domain-containing protein [unclassified Roseobacter]NNW55483.1 hypothetical protein [Roseobacter sp. HKCCD8284]NNY17330.1 hypothetical protein [Roseobacter sp. HKCCD8191]